MPLNRIPDGRLRLVTVPAAVVYLLAFIPFLLIESGDIVRLELAGTQEKASEIVTGWSPAETVDMAFLQGVDELHPFAYGLLLATAAIWAGRTYRGRAVGWGPTIAWVVLVAVVMDLIENIGMIAMIRGDFEDPIPAITTAFAFAKFTALFVAVLYVLGAAAVRLRGKGATANAPS